MKEGGMERKRPAPNTKRCRATGGKKGRRNTYEKSIGKR